AIAPIGVKAGSERFHLSSVKKKNRYCIAHAGWKHHFVDNSLYDELLLILFCKIPQIAPPMELRVTALVSCQLVLDELDQERADLSGHELVPLSIWMNAIA